MSPADFEPMPLDTVNPTRRLAEPATGIRLYEADDEVGVIELLQAAFGRWPQTIEGLPAAEFFRWKHLENPFGQSVMLVAADEDGEVQGFISYLRWRLRTPSADFEALRVVDLAVRPGSRRRGLFVDLGREGPSHFPEEIALTFSIPNRLAKPGGSKLGPTEVGALRRYLRPRHGALGWIALGAARLRREEGGEPAVEAMPASEALGDEGVAELLPGSEASDQRLCTAKDLEYLRWRYGSLVRYRAIRVERDGRLAGLAIFRLRRWGRLWVSVVCELLEAPGEGRLARSMLKQVARASRADCLLCHFPSGSAARRAAARSLFVRLPRPQPLLVRQIGPVAPDPLSFDSWALGYGDVDLL